PATLSSGGSTPFLVVVKGTLGPGQWKTERSNGSTSLGTAQFWVPDRLSHLRPRTTTPNQLAITLTRGRATSLLLNNDDAAAYSVKWDFQLKDVPKGKAAVEGVAA